MKKTDELKALRGKDVKGLNDELAAVRREQFNLRMQAATGQAVKSHTVTQARKKVARLKTLLQQQAKAS